MCGVDVTNLSQIVQAKEEDVSTLQDELDQKEQLLRHKDIRLMRIAQLETALQTNKIQHQFDLQKLQVRAQQCLFI